MNIFNLFSSHEVINEFDDLCDSLEQCDDKIVKIEEENLLKKDKKDEGKDGNID